MEMQLTGGEAPSAQKESVTVFRKLWVVAALCIFVYPLGIYLLWRKKIFRGSPNNIRELSVKGKWLVTMIATFLVAARLLTLGGNTGDPALITLVSGGTLKSCPDHTVGEMAASFMGSPQWEAGKGKDGTEFVNINSSILMGGKNVDASLQFIVNKQESSFSYRALEINGVPQINLVAMGLMQKMCEAAKHR
ncbi:hypothetical protein E6C67_01990 [Azospirillum sp. TSA2s]|uniref:RnfABCDGE type electron transport complex subunit D n=1 Tax=Azospirillum sp. TSA2s TaxID=709810 RepID=UPI0010A9A36A|nr:RnfABCDGE type electron transport complex subunit D [Azospirillum sp. TSA2s]QCG92708.1 hypothetical protein E6C67_01990 [Azospirillum sp. TSA2s]